MSINFFTAELASLDRNPTNERLREYCLIMSTIAFFFAWATFTPAVDKILVFLGALIFFIGIIKPKMAHYAYIVWMGFSSTLGVIMSYLILGIIFYAIATPIALLLKLVRRDILNLKLRPEVASYWKPRNDKKTDCEIKKKFYSKMYSPL